ncbi:Hsp20/alpha crystallin family protein [Baaleninema sp.]|uniref:Hsp20/alpha crystallin family protein n=1 Tax=Baaleninema sp. TaxID=3101197 RepID=UPI003D00F9EE
MTLVRWNPTRDIDSLHREMNRLFDALNPTRFASELELNFGPPAELHETDEAVILKLEVPGMNPEDLDIDVTRDAVSIRGERKQESETEENGTIRSEFRYGQFSRVISLPTHVDNSQVEAQYRDGLLTLTLPKVEEEKHKSVKVKVER